MKKPSPQLQNLFLNSNEKSRMFFSGLLRKIKCSRLFESFLGVLGFFLVGVFVIGFLYYMDYGVSAAKYRGPVKPERFKGGSGCGSAKVEFLSDKGGECDVFDGDWVWDESYPLYRSKDCSFLDNGFRCSENGRPDLLYTKWRWQPKLCNLPRFLIFASSVKIMHFTCFLFFVPRLVFSVGENSFRDELVCYS